MKGLGIRKWYLDGAAADGRVWVGYWASVRAGPVSFCVASLLESAPGMAARSRISLRGGDEPREVDGVVTWAHEELGVRGVWTRAGAAVERELLNDGSGAIRWRCAVPATRVELETAGGRVSAAGYAEVMDMTVVPWRVPIRELRWGRAVADDGGGSVVWIDWRGERARTDVFVDGAGVDGRVGDDAVEGAGFALTLMRDRTLRDGAIGTTALAGVPWVSTWAPARFLSTHETKWVSRGAFESREKSWSGWAIHEVVRFAQPEG